MDEKDNKEYELAVLVKTEDDLSAVTAIVKKHNGEMTAEPRAKRLAFAYEVEKVKEGVFAHCTFRAAGEDVKNLESDLVRDPLILRALIIASPPPAMSSGDRPMGMPAMGGDRGGDSSHRRSRITPRSAAPAPDAKPAPSQPLSNEALEKKIEEFLHARLVLRFF